MRFSTKHGLSRSTLAVGLAVIVTFATGASALAAGSGAAGASSPLRSTLSSSTEAASSAISIEIPHVIGIKVETPALNVEAPELPKVEVPGVLKVEAKSAPSGEAPSLAKVEVSTPAPTASVPEASTPPVTGTTTTKAVKAPKAAEASGQPTGSPTATTATVAGASASGASAPSTGASGTPTSHATRSSGTRSPTRADRHAAADRRSNGTAAQAGLVTSTSKTPASKPVASAGAALTRDASRRPSSSDPLSSLGRQLPLPLPVPDWSKPIILLLLLLAIGFAVRSQLAARRARRLERQHGTLQRDLDVMQAALVPVIPERLGALSVSVAYRPADGPAAGGDFYDLIALDSDKVAIVLGDVVGHGRGALERSALTRYTLRAYLQAGLEPRAVLALASSVLTEPGEKQFATVVVGIHDGASGRLTYASAGHPPPISVGFETREPLTVCSSAPLCCDLPTGRRQTTISIPTGGRMCFFSDGLLEARIGDDLLGRERLSELAREAGAPPTAAALLERVSAVAQTARDDMVACVISPAARAPIADGTVEELEVDREALQEARVARFLQACGLTGAAAASLLADATRLVAADGTALLRIELASDGGAQATARAGLSVPDWASVAPATSELGAGALALPAER
ncbi:MAG TPA: SpoIIE family protein phosphatase [Solirubrobacteraceae bacterium]|jgi:serine phosphatase RsbU (regulator of sigma subunit)|nr:SpoIIE family protein phosphatase [Solirubrobacteraceae bacterium]